MPDLVGWLATAIFAASYFCKRTTTLRRVQGVAALAWATYGVLIHSLPILVANVIVASLAFGSSLWRRPGHKAWAPGSLQAQQHPGVGEPTVHPELRHAAAVDEAAAALV